MNSIEQPSIVLGETALETYDRMGMERTTHVTIKSIIDHYRELISR